MNVNQINQNAINSLHQYFENDYTDKDIKVSTKQLSQDEITEMVKNQANIRKTKNASLEVLRKNINIKAKNSLDKVIGQNKTTKENKNKLSFDQYYKMLQDEKVRQINIVKALKAALKAAKLSQ